MGLFVNIVGTTTPLTSFNETVITYLAATNAGWLPYLVDEGIGFSWRAYRNLGTSFTCINSAMGLFVDTVGTLDWL